MTPLSLPANRFRWTAPAARRRLVAFAAPLAAATAVAAVITATVVAHTDAGGSSPNAGSAGGPALHLLPRDYVALTRIGPFNPVKVQRTEAVVASTVTGRKIATIKPPAPYNAFTEVSGTADGRTYVLAAQDVTKAAQQHATAKFFELRVSATKATLSALPIPLMHFTGYSINIAMSPDGSQLAVTGTWPKVAGTFSPQTGLRVYNLGTGKLTHFWQVLPPPPPGHCCVFDPGAASPSWEADTRYIALDVTLAHCQDCVALLDTSNTAPSVQAAAKVILRTRNRHHQVTWTETLITGDGARVLRSAQVFTPISKLVAIARSHVFTDNARTGKTESDQRGPHRAIWTLAWTSPSGRAYVVMSRVVQQPHYADYVTAAIFSAGRWTPIPLPAKTFRVAW
jgi:hypothetical protein